MMEITRLVIDAKGACKFVQDLEGFKRSADFMKTRWQAAVDSFTSQCITADEIQAFLQKYKSLEHAVETWQFEGPLALLHLNEKDEDRDEELNRMESV